MKGKDKTEITATEINFIKITVKTLGLKTEPIVNEILI
jgi:hypothetical protein